MEAAGESKRQGGMRVDVPTVKARAEKKAAATVNR